MVENKKMVHELYDMPFIQAHMVIEMEQEIYVENIWGILKSKEERRRERKKRKHRSIEKET